jgi:hypothetical protein
MIDPATKLAWACPLNGALCVDGTRADFPKNEVGGLVKCRWWQHVAGKDPQSEKMVDQGDCAIAWMPTVGIEGSQMSRQTAASVDKVANEVADVKLGLNALAGAVRVAAAGISQAVESGALTVMLPTPGPSQETNGHDTRDLKEGDKPHEN